MVGGKVAGPKKPETDHIINSFQGLGLDLRLGPQETMGAWKQGTATFDNGQTGRSWEITRGIRVLGNNPTENTRFGWGLGLTGRLFWKVEKPETNKRNTRTIGYDNKGLFLCFPALRTSAPKAYASGYMRDKIEEGETKTCKKNTKGTRVNWQLSKANRNSKVSDSKNQLEEKSATTKNSAAESTSQSARAAEEKGSEPKTQETTSKWHARNHLEACPMA